MASINFEKLHTSDNVAGLIMHNDSEQRQIHNHTNPDIDKSKSHENVDLLGDLSYADKKKIFEERIKFLDENGNKNKRKDRVVALAVYVPAPTGIENRDELNQFFLNALEIISEKNKKNVIAADIHYDEIHDYIDQNHQQVQSRPHMHVIMVPEVNGQLNAKNWTGGKKVLSDWQKKIDELAQSYGATFLTGEQKNHHKTVEELKNSSEVIEKNKILSEQNQKISDQKNEISETENRLTQKKSELKNLKNEIEKLPDEEKISRKLEAKRKADDEMNRYIQVNDTNYVDDPVQAFGRASITGRKITLPTEVVNQLETTSKIAEDALYLRNRAESENKDLHKQNDVILRKNAELRAENANLSQQIDQLKDQHSQDRVTIDNLHWDNSALINENSALKAFKRAALSLIADISALFSDQRRYAICDHIYRILPVSERNSVRFDGTDYPDQWNTTTASILARISAQFCRDKGIPWSQQEAQRIHDECERQAMEFRQRQQKKQEDTAEQHEHHQTMHM